jgi:predicted small integral membrane protein
MLTPRHLKAALVGAVAFYMSLVVLGNVLDPAANYAYVQHVFSMDTVFPANTQTWRALRQPIFWRLGFAAILLYEIAVTGWLLRATQRLLLAREAAEWAPARDFASAALVATMLLWLVPFITVGGEWFQMWQSEQWKGIEPATRNFTVHGIVLLYLQSRHEP